jgi:hypothetical protein
MSTFALHKSTKWGLGSGAEKLLGVIRVEFFRGKLGT